MMPMTTRSSTRVKARRDGGAVVLMSMAFATTRYLGGMGNGTPLPVSSRQRPRPRASEYACPCHPTSRTRNVSHFSTTTQEKRGGRNCEQNRGGIWQRATDRAARDRERADRAALVRVRIAIVPHE